MEWSIQGWLLLPVALGLLGFIEPCTIGGHLVFLGTIDRKSRAGKTAAAVVFVAVRALVTGLFGALIAYLGQFLIGVQTGMWLVLGLIYLGIGLMFFAGARAVVGGRLALAPEVWKRAGNPVVLGLAFGLNIPACAAPIVFALLGLAATTGTAMTGFVMMAVFGLFLSLPLVGIVAVPKLSVQLESLGPRLRNRGWLLGTVFVFLGLWSVWFGLFVDPADWSGR